MKDAVVGIDIGTTSTKGVLVDTDGLTIASASREATLTSPHPTWAEMDPEEWWTNTVEVLRTLVGEAQGRTTVRAIGVSGMVPALVLLDEAGRPLRPSIQQNDARTPTEIAEVAETIGQDRFFELTGGSINQQVLAPKFRWLGKHEPDVLRKTARVCGSYDFIGSRLTGVPYVEHNWALEAGLVDVSSGSWHDELIAVAGINRSILPPIVPSHHVVGEITPDAAQETGLASGTPVIAGVADHVASAFTAGVARPGDLLVKFGGAGDVLYALDDLVTERRLFIDHHVTPGAFYLNGCMATSGSLVKWFARSFAADEVRRASESSANPYAWLDEQARPLPPGSDGLVVLPYFLGEKTPLHDPNARGTIVGLGLHHGRGHLFRAVLEAVAYGFRHHVEVLTERSLPVRRVLAADGGAASDLWLQITADVLGYAVHRVEGTTGSSLGAAFVAGKATGIFDAWSDIELFARPGPTFEPRAWAAETYSEYYSLYRDTYERLRTLYPRLADVRRRALKHDGKLSP